MADSEKIRNGNNEEQFENTSRRNDWEVVTLTDSTYASAPNPGPRHLYNYETTSSDPMFMSRHFIFPPSQHENLPLSPQNEIHTEERGKSDINTPERLNINTKNMNVSEYPGIPIFDKNGNITVLEGDIKEQGIYGNSELDEQFEEDNNKNDETNLPCEAWWKKRVVSLYSHAKEANTFWSIFVAAAVMGLVIINQRWQIMQKLQFGINDERMFRIVGPLTRLKDVIVGGARRGSFIRGSSSGEH